MHVVFLEPCFPANQPEFVRALHEVGATVTGIGERPKSALTDDLKRWLTHYEQVPSVVDPESLAAVVGRLNRHKPVDRLEATVEAHVLAAAQVREAFSIPGTSVRTTFLCRDKPAMKEVLREGGVRCARSIGTGSVDDVREFAEEVGYPLVVKPRAAAGAQGTYRVEDQTGLDEILTKLGVDQGNHVAVEEFITGHEAFYDTITIGGSVAHEFITHYYPNVLEAMRTRWISPQFITTNRLETAPGYQDVLELGRRVNQLVEIDTSATHMEWFIGEKGLVFSEIGCRPPGVRAWDLYCAANGMDLYVEWALAICWGRTGRRPSREFAAGIITLRPDQDGTISHYEGLEEVQRRYGEWILDHHIPPEGSPTQPVEAGYMANAWIRMRHPNYDRLREMLNDVGETVQVRAH